MTRRTSSPLDPPLPFTDTERGDSLIGLFVGIDGAHRLDTEPTLLDAIEEAEPTPWFVVVERNALDPDHTPLPAYVVGPYATQALAAEEGNSDGGTTYSLLTIDAKNDKYEATECYWTTTPPTFAEHITPHPECPYGHGPMTARTNLSPEAAWCGEWFTCTDCKSAVVIHSPALTAQLATQEARA